MKVIHLKTIIKIKLCQFRIFVAQDDEYFNDSVISANERAISRYIKDYTEEEQHELISTIDLVNDNCVGSLEKLGWKIVDD